MRKLLVLLAALMLAAPAQAAFQGPTAGNGGFRGPGNGQTATVTVEQAKRLPDDAKVTLTGSIVNQLPNTKDKYTFRDQSGDIQIDVDRKVFRNQTVTPESIVRIQGEVEKDFGHPVEIDVNLLEIVN